MSRWLRMWRALLKTQWTWTRGMLLGAAVLVFAMPLLSVRTAVGVDTEVAFIRMVQRWGVGYAIVAGALGLFVAIAAWSFDHRLKHIYALSLPIARWQYVLMRFVAGAVLLLLPMAALLVGAEVASHNASVPATLRAYPFALTFRFLFAALVAYAIVFAVSAGTERTARYILATIGLFLVAQLVLISVGSHFDLSGHVADVLFARPGLLSVFSGRWSLIDV